ncbi:MAG: TlpA disulfide reductase family protein [Chloroherpetonaceae bacterium]|nr:TlpA disulfide reductase family protein [Chloroherpetonaceae bacterium]
MKLFILPALLVAIVATGPTRVRNTGVPASPDLSVSAAPAPNFTLKTLNGKKVSLSDFKGKGVILNFWATWCPPCRAEIPDMIELQKAYQDKFTFIGIVINDRAEKVAAFVKAQGMNYPVVMGDEKVISDYGKFVEGGQIRGIPTSFVINRKGEIIEAFVGARDKRTFEAAIQRAIQ